jgi:transcriptional regulator with XRE-family HTH domain
MKPSSFKAIGKYFKDGRMSCGLTQEQVSGYLGYLSKQIVSNWERGLCAPPLHELSSLITVLKLDRKTVIDLFMSARKYELLEVLRSKNGSK